MSNWLERANEFIRLIDPPYHGDELDEYIDHVYEVYRNNRFSIYDWINGAWVERGDPTPPSIHERITLSKYREGIAYERKRSFEEQREYIASEWMGQEKEDIAVSTSSDSGTFSIGEDTWDWDWDEMTQSCEIRPRPKPKRFWEFMKWKLKGISERCSGKIFPWK